MRLLLQQRPDGREAPRYVQLMLERDLLGAWTLVRETGQAGGRSSVRRDQYLDQAPTEGWGERESGVLASNIALLQERGVLTPPAGATPTADGQAGTHQPDNGDAPTVPARTTV